MKSQRSRIEPLQGRRRPHRAGSQSVQSPEHNGASREGTALPAEGARHGGRLALCWRLVAQTSEELSRARANLLAAAIAFQCLLSIAPLIIVAVALAGLVLGRGEAVAEVKRLLVGTVGVTGASRVQEWVKQAAKGRELASLVGFGLTAWGASSLGLGLRDALNQLWGIEDASVKGVGSLLGNYLRRRLSALLVVATAAPLLLFASVSRTVLAAFHAAWFASSPWQGIAFQLMMLVGSFSIVALVAATVFRYVPDMRTGWKDVFVGGALTSALFNIGNALVAGYLGMANVSAVQRVAGSTIVALLWLHFSAYTFLIGAEFSHVYAQCFRPRIRTVARPGTD
jgi:membrane protein